MSDRVYFRCACRLDTIIGVTFPLKLTDTLHFNTLKTLHSEIAS